MIKMKKITSIVILLLVTFTTNAQDKKAKELGTTLRAPFMTLSFMALLVIPKLKLSDKGLFDGETFQFTNVFVK